MYNGDILEYHIPPPRVASWTREPGNIWSRKYHFPGVVNRFSNTMYSVTRVGCSGVPLEVSSFPVFLSYI